MLSLPWVLGRVLLCSSREEPSTDSRIALLFFVWAPTVVFLHPTGDSLRRIPAISEQAPDVFSSCSSHCVLADVSNIVLSLRNQPQLSTNLSSVNSDRCYGDSISRKEPSLFSTETFRDSTLICSLIIWLVVFDGGQRMHHTRNSNATTSRWQSPCWSEGQKCNLFMTFNKQNSKFSTLNNITLPETEEQKGRRFQLIMRR